MEKEKKDLEEPVDHLHHHHHVPAPLQKQEWTPFLVFCNLTIVTGSSFMFGYNAGVINAPFAVMNAFLNESFAREGKILTKDQLSVMWSLVVALHLIGGVVGSVWFPAALILQLGRRKSLMVSATIGAVGAAVEFIAPWTGSYIPLMVGRGVVGFATGLGMVIAPGLVTDHAPSRLRGSLGSLFSFGSPLGVTVSNLVGLPQILGRASAWHYLFLIVVALYVTHGICLFFVVESPKYLIEHKREDEAIQALMKLRSGTAEEVKAEMEEDKFQATHHHAHHEIPILDFFRYRHLFWPMFIVINLHITNQLTGLGAAFYYATKVMKEAGLDNDSAALANFGISFATILGNVLCIIFADRLGRRLLMLVGLFVVIGANVMLCVVIQQHVMEASAVGFAVFLLAFASGPGPLPFFMSAELTSRSARPMAVAVGMVTNWSGKILVSFIFPLMQLYIASYSFLPFAGVSCVEFVFLLFFLPETSHQIVHHFHPDEVFASGRSLLHLRTPKQTVPAPQEPAVMPPMTSPVAPAVVASSIMPLEAMPPAEPSEKTEAVLAPTEEDIEIEAMGGIEREKDEDSISSISSISSVSHDSEPEAGVYQVPVID